MTRPPAVPGPLGAILAGGGNRRYGAHKALARVGGQPILERVRRALAPWVERLVLVANDREVYAAVGLPLRPDARPGLGALGGIHTAVAWAAEEGRPGVLVAACDMPFLSPALLAALVEEAFPEDGPVPDVVVPESGGPRGLEPLCAYYATSSLPAIEAEIARGERHVIGFFADLAVRRIPLDRVRAYGKPDVLFLNVNTPAERERAEAIARGG